LLEKTVRLKMNLKLRERIISAARTQFLLHKGSAYLAPISPTPTELIKS